MSSPLSSLGVTSPVLAAPMAGGPGGPALVVAAARTGGLGFLAGGYRTADALERQIREVRGSTGRFGVNLFAPNPVPIDERAFRDYARRIAAEGEPYGLDLAGAALTEDDDHWKDKVDLLLAEPVPVAGFTFGIPERPVVDALHGVGTLVAQTVTTEAEARQATEAGADLLVVQGAAAGGHSGTLTPDRIPADVPLTELLGRVRAATDLPLLGAGGLADAGAVAGALRAGAAAVLVGTVLLRSAEAGTSATHRAALADPARTRTGFTRAFTGRPARALTNAFVERYDGQAPLGYPALHHLTGPLRRAAAAAGDADRVHLWAGTGFRAATEDPAADILTRLAARS
jgi:nitronate monooxygenase